MPDELMWAIGRGTGVALLLSLTLSVVIGLVVAARGDVPGLARFATTMVHRNISVFSMVLLAGHLISLFLDSYAKLALLDLFLPFASAAANPLYVGAGTLAFECFVAVLVTALLRHRLGFEAFKAIHWFSYLAWLLSMVHAVGSGTDASSSWFVAMAVGCGAAVGIAGLYRLLHSPQPVGSAA